MEEQDGTQASAGLPENISGATIPAVQSEASSVPIEPLVKHKKKRRKFRLALGLLAGFAFLVCVALGGLFVAIERGLLDAELARRAEAAINDSLGGRFVVKVERASLRFSSRMALAVEAQNVGVSEPENGKPVAHVKAVQLVLDPLALMSGRLYIGGVDADGLDVDTALLSADGESLEGLRVDSIPQVLDKIFSRMDAAWAFLERSQSGDMTLSRMTLRFPGKAVVSVEDILLARQDEGGLSLTGRAVREESVTTFAVSGHTLDGRVVSVDASFDGLDLAPITLRYDPSGVLNAGLASVMGFSFSATRADEEGKGAALQGRFKAEPGMFYADYESQEFSGGDIRFFYDFDKDTVEFTRSHLSFGRTVIPFTGAVADRDRQGDNTGPGYILDFLSSGAVSGATDAPPLTFDAKASGVFDTREHLLRVDRLLATSAAGNFAGSLVIRHVPGGSPEISFGGQVPDMAGDAVKQLWPFWMARKPRQWAVANLDGGRVRNGVISVFVPAGRILPPPIPLELHENELHVGFDVENLRVDLPPDIPPLRDVAARVEIHGGKAEVLASHGISYFGSGRSVTLDGGRFAIENAYVKPLMADLNVKLSGDAAAVVELASFRPMNGLKHTEFRPEDFSGPVKADVEAHFGLLPSQSPPEPVWKVGVGLDGVDVHRPIGSHQISKAQGQLDVIPTQLALTAKARVDDAPVDISYRQPLGNNAGAPEIKAKAKLEKADWMKLAPQLGDFIEGPLAFELERIDDKKQAVTVDLRQASVVLPWVGWSKGSGVAAQAKFDLSGEGDDNAVHNLQFGGDGFGANGNLNFNRTGLVSADFSRVVLSPGDDFALTVKNGKAGYEIGVSGKRADARNIIGKMKSGYEAEKPTAETAAPAAKTRFAANLKLGELAGFNDETLSNFTGRYAMKGSDITAVEFTATTDSNQALVGQMLKDGRNTISITSGDAGAFARFIDLYKNMAGGLLNLKMFAMDAQSWSGSIDIRNFRLTNEQRLQSMVSTPTGADGKSLSKTLKKDINVNSAGFQRAFGRLVLRNSVLVVENGVLRGDQVGATFQGTVRDRRGRMDLTGTFMPAYGLNSLFAELPIIGSLLGNGRDKGLIGITFRLSGKFTKPDLTINPLSVIAPGVFRQIFEY